MSSNVAIGSFELNPWDVSLDGRHFLMIKEVSSSPPDERAHKIAIVLNWFEELKQRVPVK